MESNWASGPVCVSVGLEIRKDFSNNIIGVLDREGNARKVVNCSCVVVKDWGEESQERSILLNYFQTEQ
jgi:hypothetical protein